MLELITYGELQQYLLDLGFEDKSVEDSHAVFHHAESETLILLALHKPGEPASLVDVRRVRRILIERGLVLAEDFDQFVRFADQMNREVVYRESPPDSEAHSTAG